jgi:hypothetical protein
MHYLNLAYFLNECIHFRVALPYALLYRGRMGNARRSIRVPDTNVLYVALSFMLEIQVELINKRNIDLQ